jgi:hypothetical protein
MKIAIAIFGIPRGANLTHASFMANIVEQAQDVGDVKLFGHLFNVSHVVNTRSGEGGSLDQKNFDLFRDFNFSIEQPELCLAQYDLNTIMGFGDYYGDGFKSVKNLIHQLHSLKTVTKSMQDYAPDAVIFARPDLLYHDKFPGRLIRSAATNPNRLFIPTWQWWGGYNDRFSICGSHAYLQYGLRVDNILRYCLKGSRPLHAERLLRESIRSGKASLRTLNVRASRVRIGDVVKDEVFDARRTVGPRRLLPEMALGQALTRLHL